MKSPILKNIKKCLRNTLKDVYLYSTNNKTNIEMAYNYEYEDYIERKHNTRFDAVNAVSRSERIKKILDSGEYSKSKDNEPERFSALK